MIWSNTLIPQSTMGDCKIGTTYMVFLPLLYHCHYQIIRLIVMKILYRDLFVNTWKYKNNSCMMLDVCLSIVPYSWVLLIQGMVNRTKCFTWQGINFCTQWWTFFPTFSLDFRLQYRNFGLTIASCLSVWFFVVRLTNTLRARELPTIKLPTFISFHHYSYVVGL
jgi:hypothetical protein